VWFRFCVAALFTCLSRNVVKLESIFRNVRKIATSVIRALRVLLLLRLSPILRRCWTRLASCAVTPVCVWRTLVFVVAGAAAFAVIDSCFFLFWIKLICCWIQWLSLSSSVMEWSALSYCNTRNLGNACYYSVQNLLSSSLLSKKLRIKIYRTIVLPVVLYGCETWSLTLREERRLRLFESRVLRRVFGPKRDEAIGNGENYIMSSLVICTPYPILCGW